MKIKKPSSEETVLPNPRCLISIYVSSMVVLGWCSCVYKPFLGDSGATLGPSTYQGYLSGLPANFGREDQGGYTPINVASDLQGADPTSQPEVIKTLNP